MPSDGSFKLSEKEAERLSLILLGTAFDILGAVAQEATYVESRISAIRTSLDEIIFDVGRARFALKGEHNFHLLFPVYDAHREIMHTTNMLHALRCLAELNSELLYGNELRPQVVAASNIVAQAMALVSRAVEVFRHRSIQTENIVLSFRNLSPDCPTAHRVYSREVGALINAFIDTLDMIMVNIGEHLPELVKSSLLSTSASFICVSRCLERSILDTRYCCSSATGAALAILDSTTGAIESARWFNEPLNNSDSTFALLMARSVVDVLRAEIRHHRNRLYEIETREEGKLNAAGRTMYYGLLQSVCCSGLMWYTCKQQGLDANKYSQSIRRVHLLVHDLWEMLGKALRIADDDIVQEDLCSLVLSSLEVAQKNLHMHRIPSSLDQEQFLNLTQRANEAINWTCDVCVEYMKQIYGTGESHNTSVGTSIDVQSVGTHVAPEERGGEEATQTVLTIFQPGRRCHL